ncbi:AGE family epimerase/isomerase [Devosia lacusdianchii]|uniref:AGE family epimerase/isomerase n=1 Tax=Devosia lacusdianchii TaxID=2917991 RepID=UPI001F05A7FB|nr:AGE family epimerase/isomerase [Devosia sp. JXJ CY 41]
MSDPAGFIERAARVYVDANAASLHWLLARPLLGPGFLNSKQNSMTLADYGPGDGLRSPQFTYGWIQGRGLEALVTHAAFFAASDPELTASIDAVARPLYDILRRLWSGNGHAYFCYDPNLEPIVAAPNGVTTPQAQPAGIYTYSDIFVLKGLIAAAARYDVPHLDGYLAQLPALVDAIEGGQFQMDERQPLSAEAARNQPADFGPRMILLGAAGMLNRIGRPDAARFADRFIAHVLEHYLDPASGLLRNVPGMDVCNVGHGIEFVGFVLDYLPRDADLALMKRLQAILIASFNAGLHGPGVALTVSVASGRLTSPYCPWWSLPETIRSAALCHERTGDARALDIWQKAHAAFFDSYWRGEPAIAYQTMTKDGPVDFVPATPDLDPGYHTGLSLLAAVEAATRMGAGSALQTSIGA